MKLMLAVRFAFEEGDSISVTDYGVKDGVIRTLPNTHIQLSEVSSKVIHCSGIAVYIDCCIVVHCGYDCWWGRGKWFSTPWDAIIRCHWGTQRGFCRFCQWKSNRSMCWWVIIWCTCWMEWNICNPKWWNIWLISYIAEQSLQASSQGNRVILILRDQEDKRAKLTLWEDVGDVTSEIGTCYILKTCIDDNAVLTYHCWNLHICRNWWIVQILRCARFVFEIQRRMWRCSSFISRHGCSGNDMTLTYVDCRILVIDNANW